MNTWLLWASDEISKLAHEVAFLNSTPIPESREMKEARSRLLLRKRNDLAVLQRRYDDEQAFEHRVRREQLAENIDGWAAERAQD